MTRRIPTEPDMAYFTAKYEEAVRADRERDGRRKTFTVTLTVQREWRVDGQYDEADAIRMATQHATSLGFKVLP